MTKRLFKVFSLITVLALMLAALPVQSAGAVSTTIVISQVYGGGGNAGATYRNDFIELFNRGNTTVSLTGWSVQYTSATGTGNFGSQTNLITPLSGSLVPGQYLLIQEAQGAGGTTNLPTPDVTDGTPINMSGTDGKVALVNTTVPLGCNGGSTPCSPSALATVIDLVGYGNANFFEGSGAAPTLTNTTDALRLANGCTETDNNATDFISSSPNPRNTSSPLNPCPTGVSLSINDVPASEGNSGSTTFTFTVSLSSPAGAGGVTFDIATADGTASSASDYIAKSLTGQTIAAGSQTYSFVVLVNGDTVNEPNETFFVNITNVTGATVSDGQGQGTIQNDDVADSAPSVTGTVPADNATNVSTATNITVNFSEAVNVNTSLVTLECPAGTPIGFNVLSGTTNITSLTLDPTSSLPFNTVCVLTIPATSVSDVDGNDPPDTLVATFLTDFTTQGNPCLQPATLISAVQGSGLTSPLTGSVSVQGVVTAAFAGLRGFFVQEETADRDSNLASSEGIFVFTNAAPTVTVGNQVRVTGTISEFGTSPSTATELTSPTVTDCGIGETINPTDINLPVFTVSDFEAFEGMLVRFPQELFIAEYFNYDRFGEIVLGLPLSGYNRFYNPTSIVAPGAAAQNLLTQYELRSITLDDGNTAGSPSSLPHPNGLPFSGSNSFRGADTVAGQIGVIDNSFDIYRLHTVQAGSFTVKNPRPTSPTNVGGTIKVASYNVLNYFLTIDTTSSSSSGPCGPLLNQDCRGADSASEFNRQRSKLIKALTTIDADVFGLIELENTTGVDTPGDIVNGLNAATAPGTFASINTGTIGGDAIRVGIIYKPGKVTPVNAFETIDEDDDIRFDTSRNRPSLAQTFEVNTTGARFTVVVNHLKSKGSGCGAGDPDTGDGQGECNLTRLAAAQALVDWLATDPTGSGDPDFLVIGDMNSYAKEDPIRALKAGADDAANSSDDFINLVETRLGPLAYSYVFDGQAGYLDHALASNSLNGQVTGVTDWHLNSDEPDIFDYNDTVQSTGESAAERKGFDVTDTTSPFRTSDHDPVIIGLTPNAPPTVDAGGPYSVAEGGSVSVGATGTDPNTGDTLTYAWDLDNNGSFETSGQSVSFSAAGLDGPSSYTIKVRVTDGGGLSAVDTATVNVQNVAPTVTLSAPAGHLSCGPNNATLTVSFADPGTPDTHTALIDWGDGNTETVSPATSPFSRSHTYALAGTYAASVTVTDDDGDSGSATKSMTVDYNTSGFLQPINADGTSVFKYSSTIPVKIQFTNCDGSVPANLAPTITLTMVSGATPGMQINEPVSTSAADTTGVMRFSSSQYIYNLATRPLPDSSATYRITVTVPSTGQTVTVVFGLRP
jgi:predicted extracellular nuclease